MRYDRMNEHYVADAMGRFVDLPEQEAGLFVGAYPTGFGKTFESCYFMISQVLKNPEKKFVFITEQVKNLPREDFYKVSKLEEFNLSDEQIEKMAMFLESNIDSFRKRYSPEFKDDILKILKENSKDKRILTALLSDMNAYNRALKNKGDVEHLNKTRDAFDKSERLFRKTLRYILKPYKKESERRKYIGRHQEWWWLEKLYPVVNMGKFPILFMTDKKFMNTIDPILSAPFTYWSETDLRPDDEDEKHSRLRESVIIIDEFDTFKKVVEDTLIEDNNLNIDAVRAFRTTYRTLQQWRNLPASMLRQSGMWERVYRHPIEERFTTLLKYAETLQSKYHTEHYFKLRKFNRKGEEMESLGSSFMFRDYEQYSIGNAYRLEYVPEDRYNYILSNNNLSTGASRISGMFYNLDDFFNQLCRLIRDLAFNYMDILDKDDEDRESLINCVRSIIDALEIEGDFADYVERKVLHNRLRSKKDKRVDLVEPIYYSRGFSYVTLHDSLEKQLQTHLYYTDYDSTPEYILRHMCEVTKVIGLSATGDIQSPVCNFCLSYLDDVGVYLHQLSPDEAEKIHKKIEDNEIGFEKDGPSSISTKRLDCGSTYNKDCWNKILSSRELAMQAHTIVSLVKASDQEDNSTHRYVRFLFAANEFLTHKDIRSMLCFFTASIKSASDSPFSVEKSEALLKLLGEELGISLVVSWGDNDSRVCYDAGDSAEKVWIIQVTGANFDEKSEYAEKLLSDGEKVMVVTAYQTLGAGQNLQYKVPENWKENTVWVRAGKDESKEDEQYKDFDAIYLDDPTSIAPIVEYNNRESLDRYLFFIEEIDASCQITLDDKRKQIGKAFPVYYSSEDRNQPKHFKEIRAYRLAKGKVIKQAIGRACRTGRKNKTVYFFLAPGLIDNGTFSLSLNEYGNFSNREFKEVYKECYTQLEEPASRIEELIVNAGARAAHSLIDHLKRIRTAMYGGDLIAIDKWQKWREFVLKHPTAPEDITGFDELGKFILKFAYMKVNEPINEYWFGLKDDFQPDSTDGLTISLQKPRMNKDNSKLSWTTVSESTAKLDLMKQIAGVEDFLKTEGYATDFKLDVRIMVPSLFRNIYMGALGEVVGKFLIERDCETRLGEMDHSNYEQFDYLLPNGVPVDLKDWNESVYEDENLLQNTIDLITRKMDRCKVNEVIVVNIVAKNIDILETVHTYTVKDDKKIHVIPYLYGVGNGRNRSNDKGIDLICEVAKHE